METTSASERISHLELKSLLERGGVSFFFSNGATKCIALVNSVIVLAGLTPYAYGVAELALSVVGALSICQLAGLEKTVSADMGVEQGRGRPGTARRIFSDFLLVLSVSSSIGWALLFFGSNLMSVFFTDEIGSYFVILSFLFLSAPFTIAMRVLYNTYLDLSMIALLTFLQELLKLVFLAGLLFWGGITIAGVLWSYVFAQVVSIIILSPRTLQWVRTMQREPSEGSMRLQRFFLGHNFWTIVSNYLDSVTRSFRLWLIKIFVGTEAVALFAVAQGIVGQLSSFLTIGSVVTPVLPQYLHNRPIFFRIIEKTMKYQLILACGLIAAGILAVPFLVELFFPHYVSVLPLFAIIVFALIPSSINSVFQTMFYVLRAQRNLFLAQLVRLGIIAVSSVCLLPLFGIYGIAFEYLSTAVLFSLERYRALRLLYNGFRISPKAFLRFDAYDTLLFARVRARLNVALRLWQ